MAEKENKWFEVLSGKSKPNPKNKDEVEAAQLREAIGSYEKSIGLSKITPDNSYFRFQQFWIVYIRDFASKQRFCCGYGRS